MRSIIPLACAATLLAGPVTTLISGPTAPLISAAAAATAEQIGTWLLNCPPGEPCLMRVEKPFLDRAGIIANLEVLADGKLLVPVVVLRGVSPEIIAAAASAGHAETSIQFGTGPREALNCAPSTAAYLCSPQDAAAVRLAGALPTARSITVRVAATITGMKPLPVQEKTLELRATSEALAKLSISGATPLPGPLSAITSPSPGALMAMADKALKAAGYPNGLADLQSLLAKYRGK